MIMGGRNGDDNDGLVMRGPGGYVMLMINGNGGTDEDRGMVTDNAC